MATEHIHDDILCTEEMRKVFIASIPSETQDAELKSFLEGVAQGTCDLSIVRREGQDPKKNLFGFATFETSEQVDHLLLNRTSLKFNNKDLDVNRAVPKHNTWVGAHEKTKKLFIANLPRTAKEEELQAYFEARHDKKFGTIENVQLIKYKNEDGSRQDVNRGYGFVFVSSEDMADKMAIQHQNFTFGGRKIELKKSVPSAEGNGARGRGRGRGGDKGMRGGRGGGQFQQSYGGGYEAGYGGQYATDQYAAGGGYGFGGGFDGGYGGGFGGYGGGYGAAPAAPAGGRGRGRGGNRYTPY